MKLERFALATVACATLSACVEFPFIKNNEPDTGTKAAVIAPNPQRDSFVEERRDVVPAHKIVSQQELTYDRVKQLCAAHPLKTPLTKTRESGKKGTKKNAGKQAPKTKVVLAETSFVYKQGGDKKVIRCAYDTRKKVLQAMFVNGDRIRKPVQLATYADSKRAEYLPGMRAAPRNEDSALSFQQSTPSKMYNQPPVAGYNALQQNQMPLPKTQQQESDEWRLRNTNQHYDFVKRSAERAGRPVNRALTMRVERENRDFQEKYGNSQQEGYKAPPSGVHIYGNGAVTIGNETWKGNTYTAPNGQTYRR